MSDSREDRIGGCLMSVIVQDTLEKRLDDDHGPVTRQLNGDYDLVIQGDNMVRNAEVL